jgi:alpha-L-rhamnosidase
MEGQQGEHMAQLRLTDLRCNGLKDPLGIGLRNPRLSWSLEADSRGAWQQAYHIQVAAGADFSAPVWDTGWVDSGVSIQIHYQGPALSSMQAYCWRVRGRDQSGATSDWSETGVWETGLQVSDWQARWIEPEQQVDPKAFKPAAYLRKDFTAAPEIKAARLYITCHGLYEAYLNGKRVGDQVFTPGNTAYATRLQYQVYAVEDLLQAGENCLGVILGDGWYRGSINATSTRNAHGEKLGLLCQLRLVYADGSQAWICSDQGWHTSPGPILKSDLKDGEIYDARLELDGWNQAGYQADRWQSVQLASFNNQNLIPSAGPPVRKMESLRPVNIFTTPAGQTVIDFGQNIAGYAVMTVQGPAGTTVKLQYSETLDEHGNFTLAYLGTGFGIPPLLQRDEYTLKGAGAEVYEPHFSVHGFRYVWVEGYPLQVTAENFIARAIYSDMGESGWFECSHPKLNQLHQNVLWSQKGNFLDIPTDCPTRERAGWTGDAQIFVHTGSLLMNVAAFFAKWIQDVSAEQYPNGMIRNIVPAGPPEKAPWLLKGLEGSAGWGDAIVIIPWTLYLMFGDSDILDVEYESMKRWVEYERICAENIHWSKKLRPANWFNRQWRAIQQYIWDTRYHWGEWLEPDVSLKSAPQILLKNMLFPDAIVASAYYAYSCGLLAKIAGILGKEQDAAEYGALAEKIRQAYQAEFIRPDGNLTVYPEKQAPYVRALALGLTDEALKPRLVEKLIENIERNNRHLGTGFLSTPFLCDVLSECGRPDLAYAILLQEDLPSWLYAIDHGATTIWELWDGINEQGVPQGSLNHYSKGAVVSWFYEHICGIQLDPEQPAYKHFFLRPQPGGGLVYARARYASPHGEIYSGWEQRPPGRHYRFGVPANTSATVTLENVQAFLHVGEVQAFQQSGDRVRFELPSGVYEFEVVESGNPAG